MKKKREVYFRTLLFSLVTLCCLFIIIFGVCAAYEGTHLIGYGDKKSAVELIYGTGKDILGLRILDFNIIY